MGKLLSIVIPSFNEEGNIKNTADVVLKIMDNAHIDCELVFVSDGSKDGTFNKVLQLAKENPKIKGIEFSRNFGKEAAILAGLEKGNGDCFVVMDCDLQHPPETIVEMYKKWEEGYEVVEGIKKERGKESLFYKTFSNIFYGIISKMTGYPMKNTSDFKLIDKRVAEILVSLPERKSFFRALSFWAGFNSCSVLYEVGERSIGSSKWSTISLIKYAVSNIVSFSTMPLNLVTYIGGFSALLGVILGIQTIVRWATGNALEGFSTVILLLLFLCGMILVGLGLIGKYIAAIYEEVKHRPRYLVRLDTDKIINEK